jgi:putative transcriptional regulator
MNIPSEPPKLHGRLLLAAPLLRDGFFRQSVILVGEHSASEGAYGLVLNHPSGRTVGELLPDPQFASLAKIPVHLGGPVARDQLTFAAFWSRNAQFQYATRISTEEAAASLAQTGTLVRAFAGYAGWSKNQLEEEIEQESWTVIETTPNLLSLSHDLTLWKTLMRAHSPYHRILAEAPGEILSN